MASVAGLWLFCELASGSAIDQDVLTRRAQFVYLRPDAPVGVAARSDLHAATDGITLAVNAGELVLGADGVPAALFRSSHQAVERPAHAHR